MKDNVIKVSSYEQAVSVLRVADKSGRKVILQNVEGSMNFAGLLYVKKMFETAISKFPRVDAEVILDAGDDAAAVITALKSGFNKVKYSGDKGSHAKLKNIAAKLGKKVI